MPVLGVVEQRETSDVVVRCRPLVRTDLELRGLHRVAFRGDAIEVSELDLALHRRPEMCRAELGAQHPMARVPVDQGLEAHDVAPRLEHDALLDREGSGPVQLPPRHGRGGTRVFNAGNTQGSRALRRIVLLDVPGVERPLIRIAVQNEPVQPATRVLATGRVETRHDLTRRAETQRQQPVAHGVLGGAELGIGAERLERGGGVGGDIRSIPARADLDVLAPRECGEVHSGGPGGALGARQLGRQLGDVAVERCVDASVGLDRLAVDPLDG